MPTLPRLIRTAVLIVSVWLCAAAFFGWQHYQQAIGQGDAVSYTEILVPSTVAMLLWACLTPPLLFIGDLFPVRRPHRGRGVLLAGTVAAAAALLRAHVDVALELTCAQYPLSAGALFHSHFILALIVLCVGNFVRVEGEVAAQRYDAARGEAEAAEAVLQQLRADLNPHFLFNAMNAIATLLHEDAHAAERMLDKLRDFLISAVATQQSRLVRLGDELRFVALYFDIQKMRFAENLSTDIRLSDRRLAEAAVPPLLLQPLIENSIVHGVGSRRAGGRIQVVVDECAGPAGSCLRLQVRDDGPGCAPEAIFARGRMGVANAVARLRSIYGSSQSLTYRRQGEFFVAEVVIPLQGVR